MATDGVKILDGDLAHDTYEGIMDLYDSGASLEAIRAEMPFTREDYGLETDLYHEIFVTAYALAFWELGALTPEVLAEVTRVITLQAGVALWTREVDAKTGRQRQQALDRLHQKLSLPNLKPRKRKHYRRVTHFFFQIDEVLAFRVPDGSYRALLCVGITQYRGQCTYNLVLTTYHGLVPPTPADLLACSVMGRPIESGYTLAQTLAQQPGVDEFWQQGYLKPNCFLGLCYHLVTHLDMLGLKDRFERMGHLPIREAFRRTSSYGYESSLDRFESILSNLPQHLALFERGLYPVRLLHQRG
jgi:hypothetical protein